jgi:hypothetical protein
MGRGGRDGAEKTVAVLVRIWHGVNRRSSFVQNPSQQFGFLHPKQEKT